MVLFIHRPTLLGLSEEPDSFAELVIAKNRSGEMGVIPLSFNGDLVRFTEAKEALFEKADKPATGKGPKRQRPSAWDQVNSAVGQYDPFEPGERDYSFMNL